MTGMDADSISGAPALLHVLDLLRQAPLQGKLAIYAVVPGSLL